MVKFLTLNQAEMAMLRKQNSIAMPYLDIYYRTSRSLYGSAFGTGIVISCYML